jgi:hypothetical protein
MPIDAMHKELLIRMSLFLGNKDRGQLGCTAKPFKNLDIEKALCSESVTIDHSLLMKIRRYHDKIMENRDNETSSSATSSEQTDNNFDTGHYQSKKPKKTNTPNAEQQETESSATAIKELIITWNAAKNLTNDDLTKLADLRFIHNKTETINLKYCRQITDLSHLTSCTALTNLNLWGCRQITDLSPLQSCTALTSLDLEGCNQIDLSPLASYTALTSLTLAGCDQITDLSPLANYTALASLNLSYCDQITDLSPLASCTALTSLGLGGCNQITDISPLASCTELTSLYLKDCQQITDLSLFANHPTLSELIGPDGDEVDLTSLSNTQQPGP